MMKPNKILYKSFLAVALLIVFGSDAFSQTNGNAGIEAATTQVRNLFDGGVNLMYAIGAIVGLIGAVKVFNKWNSGDPDTGKVAAAWFGSCVFLVVVALILRSFFAPGP